jgi:hypothetical protein
VNSGERADGEWLIGEWIAIKGTALRVGVLKLLVVFRAKGRYSRLRLFEIGERIRIETNDRWVSVGFWVLVRH